MIGIDIRKGGVTHCGNLSEFISDRQTPTNDEHCEAFAVELEAMLVQLVMDADNGFSESSRATLPRLLSASPLFLTFVWILEVHQWLETLSGPELFVLKHTQFTWL